VQIGQQPSGEAEEAAPGTLSAQDENLGQDLGKFRRIDA
jgi:hypothetical protein